MSDTPWTTLAAQLQQSITAGPGTQVQAPMVTPLAESGLLRVSGAKWREFLQGQLTCNVLDVTAEQAVAGASCTAKGRMLANFLLLTDPTAESAWLRLPAEQIEPLRNALGKYAVFSRVTLEPEPDWVGIGILCDDPASLAPWAQPLPGTALGCAHGEESILVRLDPEGRRFELWLPEARAHSAWEQLRQQLPAASPESWCLLDIRAGYGQVRGGTRELFLPQMLNLDLLGAVSFRKGCYTGQEVVARLHYRGKSKRRMHRLAGSGEAPAPGDAIHNEAGQNRGEIVEAVTVDAEGFEALAVLTEGKLDDPLCLANNGVALRLLSLPYAITTED